MKQVAAAIILTPEGVLLARRKPGESMSGYWEFPGGKIEPGETPQSCLERELMEELGIVVKAGAVIAETTHAYPHATIHLLGLQADILSGTIHLRVHDQVDWVPLNRLMAYRLAPADIPIALRVRIAFCGDTAPLPGD